MIAAFAQQSAGTRRNCRVERTVGLQEAYDAGVLTQDVDAAALT